MRFLMGVEMIEIGLVVASGLLILLLVLAIRRYRRSPTDANVWLVAWVIVCCIVLVVNFLMLAWAVGLRGA